MVLVELSIYHREISASQVQKSTDRWRMHMICPTAIKVFHQLVGDCHAPGYIIMGHFMLYNLHMSCFVPSAGW